LLTSSGAIASFASASPAATVLYDDHATKLDKIRLDGKDLWVRAADLPRINQFELKPQGACRADLCIPVTKALKKGDRFNLTGFARKLGEIVVTESGVWSFGEIPVVRGSFYNARSAPDFAAPDRQGRMVHLSNFRGKKVLVIAWASW
jgi:hypothetical protein